MKLSPRAWLALAILALATLASLLGDHGWGVLATVTALLVYSDPMEDPT